MSKNRNMIFFETTKCQNTKRIKKWYYVILIRIIIKIYTAHMYTGRCIHVHIVKKFIVNTHISLHCLIK